MYLSDECRSLTSLGRSGYAPIAVCSDKSAPLAMKCDAIETASHTSTTCLKTIKSLADESPIKHALDCITDPESAAICFDALSRVSGRYACLEYCPEAWRPRRSMKVKIVMRFEFKDSDVDLSHPVYTRKANPKLFAIENEWTKDMQSLLNRGLITTLAIREVDGQLKEIIKGLEQLQSGQVKGQKLAVRVSSN